MTDTQLAMPLSESQFQSQVTALAEMYGWEWMHVRAGRTADSWRTPLSGTMAKGWPDLILVRKPVFYFVELKAEGGKLSPEQGRVLEALHLAAGDGWARGIEAFVWRPSDWPEIERRLAR